MSGDFTTPATFTILAGRPRRSRTGEFFFFSNDLLTGLQLTHIHIDENDDNGTDTDGGQDID